jgi:hypothetical protein
MASSAVEKVCMRSFRYGFSALGIECTIESVTGSKGSHAGSPALLFGIKQQYILVVKSALMRQNAKRTRVSSVGMGTDSVKYGLKYA